MKFLSLDEIELLALRGYLVLENWIPKPELQALQSEFSLLHECGAFKKALVAAKDQKSIRGDTTYWLDENSPKALKNLFDCLKSWQEPINQNFFCGVTQLEAHLAYYPEGPGYEKHWDQAQNRTERKISFILYLNSDWRDENGGELVLYTPDSSKILEKIQPRGGRLVIFRSDLFPHEVRPCLHPRRSLTGWFRSDAL